MTNNFKISALQANEFAGLFGLNDTALEKKGAKRMTVNANPGFPCRVSLEDAAMGEVVILLYYQHHKTNSAYQDRRPGVYKKNSCNCNTGYQ